MRSLIGGQMDTALTRSPLFSSSRRQLSVRSLPRARAPAAIGLEVGTIPIVWPAECSLARRESRAARRLAREIYRSNWV